MNWLDKATAAGVEGFLHCAELDRLVELAADKDVLEVGSFKGLSAWGMVQVAKHITCVDTFCANSAGQFQMPEQTTYTTFTRNLAPFWKKVTCLPFSSERAAELIPAHTTFDVVFIDAMHTYEDVLADIKRWWPRVRPGGVMCLHDYGHDHFPGVKQAADEFFGFEDDPLVTLREVKKTPGGVAVKDWAPFKGLDHD